MYDFFTLSGLCIRIQLLRVKRLVGTYTNFALSAACGYVYRFFALSSLCVRIRIIDSFNVSVIRSWGFVDSFDVPMIQYWYLLIHLTFVQPLVMIGPPGGSVWRIRSSGFFGRWSARSDCTVWRILLLGSVKIFIQRFSRDPPSDSYLGLSLVDLLEQYTTRCSNITVHYPRYVVVIKYVQTLLRVFWV